MFCQRRIRFGGVHRTEIYFHSTRSHAGDTETWSFELLGRDGEPGAAPVFARCRQVAHGDDDSFDANDAQGPEPRPEASVTHMRIPAGTNYSRPASARFFIRVILAETIDAQASILTL